MTPQVDYLVQRTSEILGKNTAYMNLQDIIVELVEKVDSLTPPATYRNPKYADADD